MKIRLNRLICFSIILLFIMMTAGMGSADEVNVELMSHFGGSVRDVAIAGNYAYIGQGHDFVVLDISDVSNPSEVGRLITPYQIDDVVVSGNYAYVTFGINRIFIVNISNPSSPNSQAMYVTSGCTPNIDVLGNYAYVTSTVYQDVSCHSNLEILDLTNSLSPTCIGIYVTDGNAYDIEISGNYCYLRVYGGYANWIEIVDISNPVSPNLVGSYDIDGVVGTLNDITVSGKYAYVYTDNTSNYTGRLEIVDITNPAAPTLKGSYNTAGYASGVTVSGNYAYIAAEDLVVLDIHDPSSPIIAGIYDSVYALDVATISGNYAYLAAAEDLVILDIRDPSLPTFAGTYNTIGHASDVALSGNYAYVADGGNGLVIVDITDSSSPTHKGKYNTAGSATDVAVAGKYAYVADGANGLVIVDINNPSVPTFKGIYDTTGYASGVVVSGNYAYVADGENGLVIVDITNPILPTRKGNYNTAGYANGVFVSGNYAYIADYSNGLVIVDISNPSVPTFKGKYNTAGYANGVSISGNYAYVADWNNSLVIVDISTPSLPTLACSYNTGGEAYGVTILGNYLYVAGGAPSCFVVLDITNPLLPTIAGSHDTDYGVNSAAVSGNYAYILGDGLYIFNVMEVLPDTIPPAPVTNLKESAVGSSWIKWTWTNPTDADFSNVKVYIDGVFVTDTSSNYSVATGLSEGTNHVINIQTIDYNGNINSTLVTDSATTSIISGETVHLQLVGNIGGSATDVAVAGKYAYAADGVNGLGIFEITDSSSFELIGRCETGGYVDGVIVSGNYAYLSWALDDGTTHHYLKIVDISDPLSPKLVGSYSGSVYAVSGSYAYVDDSEGLEIVDISNPFSPKLVGTYNIDVADAAISGNYAYVASAYDGLEIVDVSNPLAPKSTGSYHTKGWANSVSISGNYAYISDEYDGLSILDITNPLSPKLVGIYGTANYAGVVTVSGNYLYLNVYNGLEIVEISDPSSPKLVGSYDTTGCVVEVSGNYVYLVDSGLAILRIDTEQSSTTSNSYAPLYDNRLRNLSPTTVLSTTTYLDVGKTSATCRDVMLFDLSNYKTTDKISKATLSLYWYYPAGATRTSDTVVEIYRPVEWDPKYVTWNNRASGMLWTTAGGNWFDKNGASQGATPYASLTFPASKVPDNKYYEFDVTSLVQDYVSGKYKNTGFFIKAKTESGNYIAFYSADASNAAVRPKLTVTSTSGSTPVDNVPTANAGADKTVTVGSAITFDASASTDDKGIASYSWDFDSSNGITSEANTVSATKTYTTAGTYIVTLTVTDTIGQKSTDTLQVIVSAVTTPVSTVSYTPINDNRLKESSPTTVLSTTTYIDIGRTTSSYRDAMMFDLSSYKTTDTISKAILSLYWYYPAGATRTSDTIVEIYRPLEWDPKYVTWNSRMSGTPWSTAGGNWFDKNAIAQGSTPYASMTFAGSSMPDNKYYEFDVTQLVQEYVSGKYKNTGFFLKAKTESGNYIAFYSSEYSNTAMRPKLTITSTSGSTPVDTVPVANAGADKTATVGSSVTFDGSASTDDKGITSYSWDFDASNGITSEATTRTASKTYTTAGLYTVTLTVTDTIGQKSTDTLQVVVNNPIDQLPVANAGSDKTATTGSAVTFDGSVSTDDKGITSYSWDFDASNGITSEATGVMTAKAYATAGTYTVTLTVTDTIGQKSTDTLQVFVSNPVSSVSYSPVYDNRLRDSSPTTVLSTTAYLDIGKSSSSCRDVMLFDLSSYKTTDTISKATLSLYWYYPAGATRTSDTVVEVYRPVEWDPKYVTWNSRMSGVLWANAGGSWFDKNGVSLGTTPYASLTFAGSKVPDNKYYEFDVTQLVQDYISGKYKNTGFFLKAKTESGNYIAFYSLESSNAAQRPKLTITR